MNILVTGGAGFIGSNLSKKLLEKGHNVTVFDNFSTGDEQNITDLNVTVIRDSISNIDNHDTSNLDAIVHLGMPSTMILFRNDSVSSMYETTVGMHKILEICRKQNCKLVFASSSSVYNSLEEPHSEDREILVKDFYTEARIFMERLAKLYSDFYDVHSIGLRLFAVYGPKEEAKLGYANMISQFLWRMMHKERPRVFGAEITRDFTHVDDITRIITEALEKDFTQTEIFNVGTGKNYRFDEAIALINEELGTELPLEVVPNPVYNFVESLCADNTKLSKYFTPPQIELRQGVKKLIAYYQTESQPPLIKNSEQYYTAKVKTK